jgi:ABC-type cobalamin/Fe3+-siderophores transport system ATPase subunit
LRAVDDVSFSLAANEILGIAGPNANGKSTLFNILINIPFPADSGRIVLDGREIQDVAPGGSTRLHARQAADRWLATADAVTETGAPPFAIFNGSNDPFLNHAFFHEFKLEQWAGVPDDVPDGRHTPFLIKPQAFNEKLSAFLRAVEAGAVHQWRRPAQAALG